MTEDFSLFIKKLKARDKKAWEDTYRYFYSSLCAYAAKITEEGEAGKDIAQSCFIKLWNSSFVFPDIKSMTAWMYRTAFNASLNYMRNRNTSKGIHLKFIEKINEEEGIEKAVKEEAVNRLSRILEKLPEQQKNIMLHTIEGKTVKEIASLLSISENTVKTHKKRAYDIIRSKMTKDSDIILWMFIKTYL